MSPSPIDSYSKEEVIERILTLTQGLTAFWSHADGWAPGVASELLSKSRLDWQASLARQLRLFLNPDLADESGALILAWAALGSLVEGVMKLFLAVRLDDYHAEEFLADTKAPKRKGVLVEPDSLVLEELRVFFSSCIWPDWVRERWKAEGEFDWIEWIRKIQQRRNAVHAFKDREIGTFEEFHQELKHYLAFMRKLTNTFPYPDDKYFKPRET